MISTAAPRGNTTLLFWNQNQEQPVIWGPEMTLFADTAAAGIKTQLAGVYHPYCSVLGGRISAWFEPMLTPDVIASADH